MFLASFLLFSVEPMIGKMVLPVLGGTPGVWNTCMVFYQALLLAGYTYAHATTSWLTFRWQSIVHILLFGIMPWFLPIEIPVDLVATDSGSLGPTIWLFGVLIVAAGMPFFMVATAAPLLQRWFSLSGHAASHDPYFLYAASNAGSLIGLIAYPWIIEPSLPLSRQTTLWAAGFAAQAGLVLICVAAVVWRLRGNSKALGQIEHGMGPFERDGTGAALDGGAGEPISALLLARWVLLAFIPSSWLLGVTTFVTTDLAAIPLLWTIPLGLYLVTFILAFARSTERLIAAATVCLPLLVLLLALVLSAGFIQLFWIPLHWIAFFSGALVCHGQLAASRPAARYATTFYLAIAIGGVLGGIFNSLLAPVIFDRIVEYPLAVILGCLVSPGLANPGRDVRIGAFDRLIAAVATLNGDSSRRFRALSAIRELLESRLSDLIIPGGVFALTGMLVLSGRQVIDTVLGALGVMTVAGFVLYAYTTSLRRPVRFALVAAAIILSCGLAESPGGRLIYHSRSFFGTLKVLDDTGANVHRLLHGNTLHGQQCLNSECRDEPSTYYSRSGPIGQVFTALKPKLSEEGTRVAIVGLGAGSMACYAQAGQQWTFYEIDPSVMRIALDPRYFTFLSDCQDRGVGLELPLGDARIKLRAAPEGAYRLIVLDAFSSDAVPVHLLSREAIQLYRSKLAEGGLLAFHLSSRYLDLEPVMGQQATDAGLACRICYHVHLTAEEKRSGKQPSIWVVMAARESDLGEIATDARWLIPKIRPASNVWTDDYSDLANYLVLGARRFPDPVAFTNATQGEVSGHSTSNTAKSDSHGNGRRP
jgi:hypothetical protein